MERWRTPVTGRFGAKADRPNVNISLEIFRQKKSQIALRTLSGKGSVTRVIQRVLQQGHKLLTGYCVAITG